MWLYRLEIDEFEIGIIRAENINEAIKGGLKVVEKLGIVKAKIVISQEHVWICNDCSFIWNLDYVICQAVGKNQDFRCYYCN